MFGKKVHKIYVLVNINLIKDFFPHYPMWYQFVLFDLNITEL